MDKDLYKALKAIHNVLRGIAVLLTLVGTLIAMLVVTVTGSTNEWAYTLTVLTLIIICSITIYPMD